MTRIDLHCHVFPRTDREHLEGGLAPPPRHTELIAHISANPSFSSRAAASAWRRRTAARPSRAPPGRPPRCPIGERQACDGAEARRMLADELELEHALDTLKLDGVLLLTNYSGVYLGDPRLDALFVELNRRRAYCFVHPDFPPVAALPITQAAGTSSRSTRHGRSSTVRSAEHSIAAPTSECSGRTSVGRSRSSPTGFTIRRRGCLTSASACSSG